MARPRTAEGWRERINELKNTLANLEAKNKRLEARRGGLAARVFGGDKQAELALAELTIDQEATARHLKDCGLAIRYAQEAHKAAVEREAEQERAEALAALEARSVERCEVVQRIDELAGQLASAIADYKRVCQEQRALAHRAAVRAHGFELIPLEMAFGHYFGELLPFARTIHHTGELAAIDPVAKEVKNDEKTA